MEYFRKKCKKWGKHVFAAAAMFLCAAVLVLVPAKDVFAQATGTVTASSANIREKADASSTAVASVRNGDKLTITEQVTGADGKLWYKVFVDADSMGYVRADLVSKGEGTVPDKTDQNTTTNTTTTTTTTTNSTPKVDTSVAVNFDGVEPVQPVSASVTKDNVRVRADSSTNSDIVTTVKKDVAFTVQGTKENGNETWYQVNFNVNGAAVNGYIRSDFVDLQGELLPVVETPPEEEIPEVTEPEPPVVEDADYKVSEQDGVWYLIDSTGEQQYQYKITSLITEAEKNAIELEKAQRKASKQTGVIVFMAILLVVLILGITLLVFKLKDMMEDEGFDKDARNVRNRANGGTRPQGARPQGTRPQGTRPTGTRPAGAGQQPRPQGTRPAGAGQQSRPQGARPQGAGQGTRPTGTRPAGAGQQPRPQGARPQGEGQGTRPAGTRPAGTAQQTRPVGTASEAPQTERRTMPVVGEEKITNQARENVATRELEKENVKPATWQSKNFLAEEDEFEFEFLNWDGEEEN